MLTASSVESAKSRKTLETQDLQAYMDKYKPKFRATRRRQPPSTYWPAAVQLDKGEKLTGHANV
jgi:hypothetical protein